MTPAVGGTVRLLRWWAPLVLAAGLGLGLAMAPAAPALAATPGNKVRPELKTPPSGTRLHVEASRITYDARSKIATATGRVIIVYGKYVLVASKVVYDQNNDRMRAEGEVRLREPGGNILEADIAQLENKFRDGFAAHLRLLLTNDATITADYARRRDGYLTVYDRVTYTRCKTCVTKTGAPLWQIRSVEATYDENEHTIYHRDVTFEFLGLPVFWTPYLSHPDPTVKRRTGFLIPTFAISKDYGFGMEVPYFINLAPDYDLTLRPLFTTGQGPLARAVWRQRTLTGQYNIDAAGIYQLDTSLPPPGDRHFRGFVRTEGEFSINDRWTWGWDGTLTSDDTFMRKYNISNRTEIDNTVYLTGLSGRNYMRAEVLQYRGLLSTDDNDVFPAVLPHIRYSYVHDTPVMGGEVSLDTSIYSLYRNDPVFSPFSTLDKGTQQTRAVTDLHWQRRMVSSGGLVVMPFADLRSDITIAENLPDPTVPGGIRSTDTTARLLPTIGLDMRYPFVRGDALGAHVFTPVAQIIAATNETDTGQIGNEDAIGLNFDHTSLFLHDRFTGYDRFEGGTRANVGFLYNLMLPAGGFVRTAFGESFHMAGDNSFVTGSGLDTPKSDLVAAVAYQPAEALRFYWQGRFDQTSLALNSLETGVDFNYGPLSMSANYLNIDAEAAYGRPLAQQQLWATADLAVGQGWKVFGGFRYDLALERPIKNLIGIGYDCDCFAFKLYYKEDYTSDRDDLKERAVMMSIEFRTLGSATVGSGL
jgi:LPS-assembly protein